MSAVVTISASYGAGGSWVGPEVAERLGWRFVDRAIPVQVAERLAVPVEQAHIHDEAITRVGNPALALCHSVRGCCPRQLAGASTCTVYGEFED